MLNRQFSITVLCSTANERCSANVISKEVVHWN